jgi:hypothetical protein
MNSTEYRAAIKQLGLSQCAAARFFHVNRTTSQRWAKDGAPHVIRKWLTFMIAMQTFFNINNVPRWIDALSDSASIDIQENVSAKKGPVVRHKPPA